MKKIIFVIATLAFLALFLNWIKIEHIFHSEPLGVNNQSAVVLYATSWCPYCKKVRKLLKDQDVSYFEYDIENSVEGLRKYKELNGKGVPVLSVNGTVIHGYDEKAIFAALKKLR